MGVCCQDLPLPLTTFCISTAWLKNQALFVPYRCLDFRHQGAPRCHQWRRRRPSASGSSVNKFSRGCRGTGTRRVLTGAFVAPCVRDRGTRCSLACEDLVLVLRARVPAEPLAAPGMGAPGASAGWVPCAPQWRCVVGRCVALRS